MTHSLERPPGNRFVLHERVGSGAMGHVYRAQDTRNDEIVALKVLKPSSAEDSDRFQREAEILRRLEHPSIVEYVDHGTTANKQVFLAMEWLQGETLAQRLRRTRVTANDAIVLAMQLSDALQAAHAEGVIHRDIKPSNLFLVDGRPDRLKVLDFGVARLVDSGQRITETGLAIGTPGYMAPEQARGSADLDLRVDLFSLGCVLFECLTARPVFVGVHLLAVLSKVLFDQPPSLRELWAQVPPALDRLVDRLLSKEPDERPQSAQSVRDQLERIQPQVYMIHSPGSAAAEKAVEADTIVERYLSLEPETVSPLTLPPFSPVSLSSNEQRVLTVMMIARPTHSIQTEQTLSLDRVEALSGLASQYGASHEILADGTVVSTLSGKHLPREQAVNAARFALALRELFPAVPMALATGRGIFSEKIKLGPVVDQAVTLLQQTEPGTISVDKDSASLLATMFELESVADRTLLKHEVEKQEARLLLGRATNIVGRTAELAMLEALIESCDEEGSARAALIIADAGVGKTRLAHELTQRIDKRWLVLEGRGDSLFFGNPFALLAPAIRKQAGLVAGEPPQVQRRKLYRRIGRGLDDNEALVTAAFIGEMIGVPFDDEQLKPLRSARGDAMEMGQQMKEAFRRFIVSECSQQPTLVLLDDLQWGDLPSVDCLDQALASEEELPLFVLALARPEVEERFPELWDERPLTTLKLSTLSSRSAEKLVRESLGDKLNTEQISALVDRADGNAFFLEELIRAANQGASEELPNTVLGMVQARLAELPEQARRVLRAASIFGKAFTNGGVIALLGTEMEPARISQWLAHLVQLEVLVPGPKSEFISEIAFQFRHDLIHEAVYAMLTGADRELAHRLAGHWLEQLGERNPRVLAEHFQRGRASERALVWFRRAAEEALDAHDLLSAVDCSQKAIDCGASKRMRGLLRLIQIEALRWLGEFHQAERCIVDALDCFVVGSDPWFRVIGEMTVMRGRFGRRDLQSWINKIATLELDADKPITGPQVIALLQACLRQMVRGHYPVAERLSAKTIDMVDQLADPGALILGFRLAAGAIRQFIIGRTEDALPLFHESINQFRQGGQQRFALMQQVHIALMLVLTGQYQHAIEVLDRTRPEAERMDLTIVILTGGIHHAVALARLGDLAQGLEMIERSLNWFEKQGDVRWTESARVERARMRLESGRAEQALADARQAIEKLSMFQPARAYAHGVCAHALLATGNDEQAIESARNALNLFVDQRELDEHKSYAHLALARGLLSQGRTSDARVVLGDALQRIDHVAGHFTDPLRKERYLLQIPEHRQLRELAQQLSLIDSTPT